MNKDLRVMSLFSGCGGIDLGFEGGFEVHEKSIPSTYKTNWVKKVSHSTSKCNWRVLPSTRFKTVFANDIDLDARKVWTNFFRKYYGRSPHLYNSEDITFINNKFSKKIKPIINDIDVVTGGFPCQDFSRQGKRKGINTIRGRLSYQMAKVIKNVKPKVFVAENVEGLTSMKESFHFVKEVFSSIGNNDYLLFEPRVLYAVDYGVPQKRKRLFFIGIRKECLNKKALSIYSKKEIPGEWSLYPRRTHTEELIKNKGFNNLKISSLKPYVVTGDIFSDLLEPDKSQKDYDQQSLLKRKPRFNWRSSCMINNLDRPSNTIISTLIAIPFRRIHKSKNRKIIQEFNQGMIERVLTVRECARIQTFPDNYKFTGPNGISMHKAYHVIGNAVPPLLGYHIAKRIESLWNEIF